MITPRLPKTTVYMVLLGDCAVGKTSIILRFARKQFNGYQESTIGAAFFTQTVRLPDHTVNLEIWDTAGQERYHALAPMYYRGAQTAIIVYDITNYQSFNRAKLWVTEIRKQGLHGVVVALAGNKLDMAEQRKVSYEEAKSYADEEGLLLLETSAKADQNITELFELVAQNLPKPVLSSALSNGVVDPAANNEVAAHGRTSCC